MQRCSRPLPVSGLTMIELLVVVAIAAVLVGLGVPSLRDWMLSQRVVSTAGEIATDLRFGRTDSISSNNLVLVAFKNSGNGCYTVFRSPHESPSTTACDCTKGAGAACVSPYTELKTYAPPPGGEVSIKAEGEGATVYELYRPGGALTKTETAGTSGVDVWVKAGGDKMLRVMTTVGLPRPTICKPESSKVSGYKPCS